MMDVPKKLDFKVTSEGFRDDFYYILRFFANQPFGEGEVIVEQDFYPRAVKLHDDLMNTDNGYRKIFQRYAALSQRMNARDERFEMMSGQARGIPFLKEAFSFAVSAWRFIGEENFLWVCLWHKAKAHVSKPMELGIYR